VPPSDGACGCPVDPERSFGHYIEHGIAKACQYCGWRDERLEVLLWKVRSQQLDCKYFEAVPVWVGVRVLGEADLTGLRVELTRLSEVFKAELATFTGIGGPRSPEYWTSLAGRFVREFSAPSLRLQLPRIIERLLSSPFGEMGCLAYALIYECQTFAPTPAICDQLFGRSGPATNVISRFEVLDYLTHLGVRFFGSRESGYEAYLASVLSASDRGSADVLHSEHSKLIPSSR
jgi:hypothetical protein